MQKGRIIFLNGVTSSGKTSIVEALEMERDAKRNDCAESIIYVWKHNSPGINLYTKCGYVAFRELDYGMYMKKGLKG